MEDVRIKPVLYDHIRLGVRNGDIALCRPSSLEGRLICQGTHAKYSHATMLGWAGTTLMVGETREHYDARLIDARSEFARWPGLYDVFRVRHCQRSFACDGFDGDAAWSFICHAAGSRYGWNHILRAYLRRRLHFPVAPIPNSNLPQWPRDCSALVHAAMHFAGGGSVKTFDCDVVPGDLSDPRLCEYRYTVFTNKAQIKAFEENKR